jgi:hypothetical protein
MTETLDATAVAQNNVAMSNEPKFNFDKIKGYVPKESERQGLIVIAPLSAFLRAGLTFTPVGLLRNEKRTKYVKITTPQGETNNYFFSKALSNNPKVVEGMKMSELAEIALLSQNEVTDDETGEVRQFFRFESKNTALTVDHEDLALLAELGL